MGKPIPVRPRALALPIPSPDIPMTTIPETEKSAGEALGRYQLLERRQILWDRLHFASWGAITGGSIMSIYALVLLIDGGAPLQGCVALLLAGAMQFLLAYQVRQRHEIAAGSMVVGYAMSIAWKWYTLRNFSGALISVGLLVVYIRGFLAAIDLAALDEEYGPEPTVN